jgi:hypothetical protein
MKCFAGVSIAGHLRRRLPESAGLCLSYVVQGFNLRSTLIFGAVDRSLLWRYIDGVRQEPDDIVNGNGPVFEGFSTGVRSTAFNGGSTCPSTHNMTGRRFAVPARLRF